MDYVHTLKAVWTNMAFVIMFMFLGGCMSFISCLSHKNGTDHMQVFISWVLDIQCHLFFSVGYTDELVGLTCTIVIIVGASSIVLFGVLAQITGKIVEITKLCCFDVIVCVLTMSYLLWSSLFIVLLPVRSLLLTDSCWTEWMSVQFPLYTEARWMYTLNFTLHKVTQVKN